jgi:hypothetical protein
MSDVTSASLNYPRQSLIEYFMSKYDTNGRWKLHETPKSGILIPPEVFNDVK